MGFGFNLLLVFILLPLTGILLLCWLITKNSGFGRTVCIIWLGVIGLVLISMVIRPLLEKKTVIEKDIYGEYVIDRKRFFGKQADWQYNHFRFEITPQKQFLFYVTDGNRVLDTDTGSISFAYGYGHPRLIINVDSPRHHIIEDFPTLYRTTWSFYYVFKSPKFGNVFFKKGHWEPIKE